MMEIDGRRAGGGREVAVMLVEVVGRSCSADCPEPFRCRWDQEDVKGGCPANCGNTSLGDNDDTTRNLGSEETATRGPCSRPHCEAVF